MLGGADNPNGELPSYITGADMQPAQTVAVGCFNIDSDPHRAQASHQWDVKTVTGEPV
ncbi:hypothetical protein P5L53_004557 [Escherichia coli]|nr:hypothetical protein [Escherichia coli]EIT7660028.1 hypothetical protein [Escherichia coli]EIZ3480470.1 hypothetical protein [Escherichia coli]EIZ3806324.1 hypothetical protein [Escherichia coli]EIZ3914703.1 hypothetical protein [Escherichia coli]